MVHKSLSSNNPNKKLNKNQKHHRTKSKIKLLNMYKSKAPKKEDRYIQSNKPAMIEPNRKWFGNTRLMNQSEMDKYKDILSEMKHDPYRVFIKNKKLPLQMLSN